MGQTSNDPRVPMSAEACGPAKVDPTYAIMQEIRLANRDVEQANALASIASDQQHRAFHRHERALQALYRHIG